MRRVINYTLAALALWLGLVMAVSAQPIDLTTQLTKFLVDLRAGTLGVNNPITAETVGTANTTTTSTDAITLQNSTASTAGVPVQMSPRLRFRSNVWNTTAVAANNTDDWIIESLPVSGSTPSGLWKLGSSLNGAGYTYPLTVASSGTVTALGTVVTAANSTTVAPVTLTHGTLLTSAAADALENDAAAMYSTVDTTNGRRFSDAWNYFRLTGSGTGITTIADFFGATGSGIPLVANGVYEIEWYCQFSQATAGIATWTVVTATTALANISGEYVGSPIAGIGTSGTAQYAGINATASSSTAFPVSGTEATGVTHQFRVHVLVTAGNGAGNTRLRLTMSAGTATPLINSYFRVRRLPAANTGAFVS